MLIVLVAPVVLAALAWFLLRTDHGTAVRAAAENTDRALLLGIPVRRNTTIVWMLAGGLAALAFILKAPFTGFAPGVATTGPTVLLPALAAAVVARMESLPVALGAGIGLGVIEQVARWNTSGSPSFVDALFVVVIVVALLLPQAARSAVRDQVTSSWSAVGTRPADPRAAPTTAGGARRDGRWRRAPRGAGGRRAERTWSRQQPAPRRVRPGVGDGRGVARDPHRVGRQHQPRPVRPRRRGRARGRQPHRRPEPRPDLRPGAGRRGGCARWRW